MRRLLTGLLALVLAASLTACAASLSVSIHVPSPSFGIFTEFERV